MPRIPVVDGDPEGLLEATQRQLGRVPNLYATLANGPQALAGYLAMRDALTKGVLRAKVREQLALLIAQENSCTYCVSAHTLRGSKMGFSDEQLVKTREAADDDPHVDAILRLAREVVRTRGRVDDDALAAARAAGVTDAELAEVVAHVALNTLSNYFNHLAEPELDFPEVKA
ncbi:carboxymuconolactone decarboxylase family protein [Yinghuangia seranimata]|uniref:carboxymuconolactone decarboxylase family protein n=1 Tax=Yinghuangia seranimata TaxID=408067 RepID=UPI00248BA860|nr:carboxymuconolactone decarboxylase family protein [Yinghuangia seranimata]MDI2132844.1 carboxymuconolactone decarboxylase family protein [Yinghuangia seranimata]